MGQSKTVSFSRSIDTLQGSLSQTDVPDVLQLIHAGARSGEFLVRRTPDGMEARLYFVRGDLVHAIAGDRVGLAGLAEVVSWDHGAFRFSADVESAQSSIELPLHHALIEAARLQDELQLEEAEPVPTSSDIVSADFQHVREGGHVVRTSTEVLDDCLKIPGVSSAVVIGRDGFLIESAGGSKNVNLETLGASLAHAVNGVEEMGSELDVQTFKDLFVEYGRAVIMCRPIGGAIIAIVAPDASKLGIIRHKITGLVDELATIF